MSRALLLTLALAGGAMAGGQAAAQSMGHAGHAMPPAAPNSLAHLKSLQGRAFDVAFVYAMIAHHQMAIDMAKSELTAGRNARVKAAAQRVISAQRREIDLMKSWQKSWGTGVGAGMILDFVGPEAGQSWDNWFLTDMISHHEGAIQMARLVPTHTKNAELRKLATGIIRDQTAEIAQYRALLGALP